MKKLIDFIFDMPWASRFLFALIILKPALDAKIGYYWDMMVLLGIVLYVGYVHHKG